MVAPINSGARVAEAIEERQLALQYITVAFSENPAWAQEEIGSGRYADLGSSPWDTIVSNCWNLETFRPFLSPMALPRRSILGVNACLEQLAERTTAFPESPFTSAMQTPRKLRRSLTSDLFLHPRR